MVSLDRCMIGVLQEVKALASGEDRGGIALGPSSRLTVSDV
jgi:hypothetical protein